MQTLRNQAMTILQVYQKRGKAALKQLSEGDFEKAMSLCLWQGAAFHNFKAVDTALLGQGIDLAHDEGFVALWSEIEQTNNQLTTLLEQSLHDTDAELARLNQVRSAISKFHSGAVAQGYVTRV